MKTIQPPGSKSGSLLIVIMIALMGAVFLGGAILSMATSARYQRVHYGTASRAYYLAESGGAYARAIRKENPGVLPSGTFTLKNGDQFIVHTVSHNDQIVVQSIGIANPGSHIEARRRLYFELTDHTETDVLPVGFDFDEDGEFDDKYWSADGVVPTIRTTGPSGHEPALDLKGTTGHISLKWQEHPELSLDTVWAYNGGLLSYDVQVKISPFERGVGFSEHYMLGISFRLQHDINNSYGMSFFQSHSGTPPGRTPAWVTALPPAFQELRGTNVYVVLWHRDGPVNSLQLINHRMLTPDDSVWAWHTQGNMVYPSFKDYSTLLLELKEQYRNGSDERENHIAAYLQSTDVYPRWASREDMVWQDDTDVFPGPLVWHNGVVTNVDSRLTSDNFNIILPPEIGVHVYYDQEGANKKFFDDFAIRVEGYAAATGTTQIQY